MTLPRPTLADLRQRASADVAEALGRGPLLDRSLLRLLAEAVAGVGHSLYGYQDWIFDQTFPDTAEREQLDRWAEVYGTPRRGAEYAEGAAELAGEPGSTMAVGTRLAREDGLEFETLLDSTIPAGATSTLARVRALEPGAASNTEPGIELRLSSPIAGFESVATVAATEIAGGADVESDDELRGRVLARLRNPGQGGNQADYVRW
ncbi:MAG: baseplate J/gp47 family protein, partial [Planctomycetota bacterium]